MSRPQVQTMVPAIAWAKRRPGSQERRAEPARVRCTAASMVMSVTAVKAPTTAMSWPGAPITAGYMSSGISGSQGPSRNIAKSEPIPIPAAALLEGPACKWM